MTEFISKHGDGVKEVAFNVKDAKGIFNKAKTRGANVLVEPYELSDENGHVTIAKIYGYKTDCVITLIDRTNYKGEFMPGFKQCTFDEPFNKLFPQSSLLQVDHIVQNYPIGDMVPTVEYFIKMLDFHRYWSIDDKEVHTEFSSLNSIVIAD